MRITRALGIDIPISIARASRLPSDVEGPEAAAVVEGIGHEIEGPRLVEACRGDEGLAETRGDAPSRAPRQIEPQRAVHAVHAFVVPAVPGPAQAIVTGRLVESGERLAAIFMEWHGRLSAEFASDETFRDLVQRMPKSAATLSVLREILAAYLKDRNWKADPNDVIDFFHAVVPTVFCQWVLLDKDWTGACPPGSGGATEGGRR